MRQQKANVFAFYNSNCSIFQKKNLRCNNIMSNYNNLSYDNYLTTKLEFEDFNVFRNNNCLQNVNKNNFY